MKDNMYIPKEQDFIFYIDYNVGEEAYNDSTYYIIANTLNINHSRINNDSLLFKESIKEKVMQAIKEFKEQSQQ